MLRTRSFLNGWGCLAAGCFFLARFFAAQVPAQTELTVDGMLLTHYVDRGELVVDASVMQLEFDTAVNQWNFNLWGNVDLTDENERRHELTETALSLAYRQTLDPLDLSAGLTQYMFSDASGTREAFLHLAMLLPLTPSVGGYYDFDQVRGTYLDGSLHHVLALTSAFWLEARVSLGYGDAAANAHAFDHAAGALRDVNAGGKLHFDLHPRCRFSVGGYYWRLLDPEVRETVRTHDGKVGGIVGSMALNYRFQ